MIKKITLLLTVSLLASMMAVAQTFTAVYAFDSVKTTSGLTDPTAVPTATGTTFGSFVCHNDSVTNPNAASRFSFTKWPSGAINGSAVYDSLTGSMSAVMYYEVTLTPQVNLALTLDSLKFTVQRSGTGIRTYSVRSNMDTYAANLSAAINPANTVLNVETGNVFYWNRDSTTTAQTGSAIVLGGTDFTNFTSPVTFRFYGWNSEASGGTFSIDNVTFKGSSSIASAVVSISKHTVTSVYPNPSTDGMFAVNTSANVKTLVNVYNVIGEVVLTKQINSGKELIDLTNQPNGSYFVSIKNENETVVKKVIINK